MLGRVFVVVLLFILSCTASASGLGEPGSFRQAKEWGKKYVYIDRSQSDLGTLYCGCKWDWKGKSGGRTELEGCGYQTRAQPNRANRIEWEHIVPAWVIGHQRVCWQNGGRKNCVSNDPVFHRAHVDLHNLTPVVGEYNADRSNYRFTMLPGTKSAYGACPSKVDFKQRAAEPRQDARGIVARTYFYMFDRYNLSMSKAQQQLFMAWDAQYPVTEWERERDVRISRVMGHRNPFVTGEKSWTLGYRNEGAGLKGVAATHARPAPARQAKDPAVGAIRGNKNSRVYHLPQGCPSYNAMATRNIVPFASEQEAVSSGYRKAGNCR